MARRYTGQSVRRLLICPWFGPLPDWMEHWERNVVTHLQPQGYDVLRVHDLDWFKERVFDTLGVDCPIEPGDGKIHDYRCAFGIIFAEELRDYQWWGHVDFDVVFGRVEQWVTDPFLESLDIHSNHHNYICGPWSLYRNVAVVNMLFLEHPEWEQILEDPTATGWVEKGFSDLVDQAHEAERLRRRYTYWQTEDLNRFDRLHWEDDRLMEGEREVMMAHFRRLNPKVYPAGCIR